MDSFSFVKILEKEKFDSEFFLFTVHFESLYMNIPVQYALKLMKYLVVEYRDEISNADFIIEFQQIFGIIMGSNVAPILANLSCKT